MASSRNRAGDAAHAYRARLTEALSGKTQLMGVPVNLSRTPGNARGRAPELGEHTESILTELLGYSWEDVAKLREEGAI